MSLLISACGRSSAVIPNASGSRVPEVAWTGTIAHTEFTIPTANSGAQAITSGPDGNMWFVETGANKIGRITMNGVITEFPISTAGTQPESITRGPGGTNSLWFTEYAGNAIAKISTSGVITTYHIPTPNSHPGGAIEGPDGNIWFTEYAANKVGRLTPTGAFKEWTIPTPGSGPYGIAEGDDQNLWFAEQNASYLGRISPTTFAITQIPINGRARYVAPENNASRRRVMWYTDAQDGRIGYVPVDGGTAASYELTPGALPGIITTGPYGDVWYTDYSGHSVSVAGSDVSQYVMSVWSGTANGIATGPDNNIWITETSTNKIGVSMPDPKGVLFAATCYANCTNGVFGFADKIQSGPVLTSFGAAWATALSTDLSGNIYACCNQEGRLPGEPAQISVYSPNPFYTQTNLPPRRIIAGTNTTLTKPSAIAVGKNVLYVWDGSHIDAFAATANGNVAPQRVLLQNGTIAADMNDNLYVASAAAIRVFSSTANGSTLPSRTISGSNTRLASNSELSGVDRSGYVYAFTPTQFNDEGEFDVFAPNANGNVAPIRSFASFSSVGQVYNPPTVFTDRNGVSYFAYNASMGSGIGEWDSFGTLIGTTANGMGVVQSMAVQTP